MRERYRRSHRETIIRRQSQSPRESYSESVRETVTKPLEMPYFTSALSQNAVAFVTSNF
ncbi:predicted protein [Arabidopsis lyrata subsp. lyrata]|uniref:Predicted protein n=1 Tax=Arabidopsis lyrata subsp. lyrata TaxID=81972 RepID=D7LXQ8_ARALL|nr:predicted protein [Arabidopsis lyrata subsp. lyrata]